MSPFRESAIPNEPKSFAEVPDATLCRLLGMIRRSYAEHKDAFAFEDRKREAEALIKSADPDAVVVLTITPSEAMRTKLDRLDKARGQNSAGFNSGFGTAERLQEEWDRFVSELKPEERQAWENLGEEQQISEFVAKRRTEPKSYLRWLTKF